jgi:hypothetical protein
MTRPEENHGDGSYGVFSFTYLSEKANRTVPLFRTCKIIIVAPIFMDS